jgi:hypothetical protein
VTSSSRDAVWPACAAAGLFAFAVATGYLVDPSLRQLDAPPLVGHWDLRISPKALLPVGAGALLWSVAPRVQVLPWRRALLAAWGMALTWAVALAAVDGAAGFTRPLLLRDDYLHDLGRVDGSFLSTFTQHIVSGPGQWANHVAGHPPGTPLLLKGLDLVGLGGAWPAAVLFVLAGTSACAAVLLTVRERVGEVTARRALPFVALAPGLLWVATSADALFLGVTAWGLALCALRRPYAAGVVLGLSLFLTYGALPLGLLALDLLRRPVAVAKAAVGVVVVFAIFTALGFWWFDGLHQTYLRVHAGAGGYRPLPYFVVANVAVLALAVGPAAVVGLRKLGAAHPLWLVVGPLLLALLIADVTGTMRGEVERIWLPYVPWLLAPAALLAHPRRWLAVQLVLALVVQLVLRSNW